jgi:hypothetical protein
MSSCALDHSVTDLERTARRRAGMKLGWYIHAGAYITVNLFLVMLAWSAGRNWAIFPALGWGLGLAIHGVVVFAVAGGGVYESLLERERRQLAARKDAW